MKRSALLLAAALAVGCALMPHHEVNISPKLVEHPVHSIVMFDPAFPEKVKRASPQDLVEMLPEHVAESATTIRTILTEVLGATVMVDAAYQPDRLALQWAAGILADLAKTRVPLSVDPVQIPAEAVLLVGVPTYGIEDMQMHGNILWFKDFKIGPKKWQYTCDMEAILLDPRTGAVLFDVRNAYSEKAHGEPDRAVLLGLVRTCAVEIARAFHTAPPAP